MARLSGKDNKYIMAVHCKWESPRKVIWILNFVAIHIFHTENHVERLTSNNCVLNVLFFNILDAAT